MSLSNRGERTVMTSGSGFPDTAYIKMHTGDPGEDCLLLAAGNTLRKQVHFAAPATDGSGVTSRVSDGTTSANATDVTWTTVGTLETYRYFSLWTHVSNSSTDLGSGQLTAPVDVGASSNFTIANGALSIILD